MSNAFLSGGGSGLTALTRGTFDLDVASVVDRGLTPGLPVAVSSKQTLVTRLIAPADLSFTPLSNPMSANLLLGGFDIRNINIITGTGDIIGHQVNNLVSNDGSSTSGYLPMYSPITSARTIVDSGILASTIVQGPGTAVDNRIVTMNGASGRVIKDSGIVVTDVVVGPASSVLNRIAVFAGTTGKLLADGGSTLAQYALLAGATFAGPVAMGANAITGTGIITASKITTTSTSCFAGALIGPFTVAYTAATAKLVDTGTLTELFDPSAEFTPTATTGRVQYTGATTRYFNVRILFNILGAASAQTYTAWVSKNGSLTQVAARNFNFTVATPAGYLPFEVSNVYQLATNDTVQLAGLYTSTANVNVFDIQVQIMPIT